MREAWWIIDQLVQQGVTQFCIAPGSRSAPLVLAAAEHPKAKTMVHTDERGVGFYALGFAKGSGKPAAIITTSGTACGNLLPAVMEAHHSATPLILLTADRPCELRECGANQATRQTHLFSSFVRWESDLHPQLAEKVVRSTAAQAACHAAGLFPGPVQLNCAFREPLHLLEGPLTQGDPISLHLPELCAPPFHTSAERGLIFLGPSVDPAPILSLAHRLQWPLFADLLSNARRTPTKEQIRHFDFLIRSPLTPLPDCILHFGGRFISKHLLDWGGDVPYIHVSPSPPLQDPARRITHRIISDAKPFCDRFHAAANSKWLPQWQTLDRGIGSTIDTHFDLAPFCEAHAFCALADDRPLFFGNSTPIRNADRFLFPAPRTFANRGLSGIDGNIATAAGLADALNEPLIALIGDQAALHDLSSLPLVKNRPLLLIISNNFGGAIFDYLPIAKSPYLETFFNASHTWSFEEAARMFDLPYAKWEKRWDRLPPSGIVEFITDRQENHQFHTRLQDVCSHAHA